MFNTVFKIVYLVEFLMIVTVRKIYTARYRRGESIVERKSIFDSILLGFTGLGMLVPLVYVFSGVLDFADYSLPDWLGWIGAALFLCSIWLLWRSHVDLGKSWTPTLAIRSDHSLKTQGVFKYIRHPMYAAHLLWAVAQAMLLHNWIAGYSLLIFILPHYLMRVGREEKMMLEQFGDEYRLYMNSTGRVLPRLFRSRTRGRGA